MSGVMVVDWPEVKAECEQFTFRFHVVMDSMSQFPVSPWVTSQFVHQGMDFFVCFSIIELKTDQYFYDVNRRNVKRLIRNESQ